MAEMVATGPTASLEFKGVKARRVTLENQAETSLSCQLERSSSATT